ncbi:MAG: glycosyltransferase, partial [Kiritimatiellae bacterium]|nr:glycosyltransferase [Kiritimatiellia bacterium]
MKVAMLIGGLGRGGTEAQLIRLAKGLHARGIAVEVWCYAGTSPLDAELEKEGIRVRTGKGGSQRQKVRLIRQWRAEFRPDVMHGFMKRASSLAVLAGFASRKEVRSWKIEDRGEGSPALRGGVGSLEIEDREREKNESERRTSNPDHRRGVGKRRTLKERSAPCPKHPAPTTNFQLPASRAKRAAIIGSDLSTATYAPWRLSLWPSLVLFGFADVVVTQTELNQSSLEKLAPWLRGKVKVIRNGLDLSRFCPAAREEGPASSGGAG